jgi:hypothetical protein
MCVCIIVLVIQNAMRMRRIVICGTTFGKVLRTIKHVC